MGHLGSCPLMKFHALPGPAMGCPYDAVGMQRALDSAIGLPSSSTSASWMLAFLMPADVSRNRMMPLRVILLSHARSLSQAAPPRPSATGRERRAAGRQPLTANPTHDRPPVSTP